MTAFLTLLAGAFALAVSQLIEEKKWKLIVGASGVLIAASIQYFQAKKQEEGRAQTEQRLTSMTDMLRQSESARERAELGRETAEKRVVDLLTGGDAFVYVAPSTKGGLIVINPTEFPIYDLNVRIVDLDRRDSTVERRSTLVGEEHFSIAAMAPREARLMRPNWLGTDRLEANFNIFVHARNGQTVQTIKFRTVNGKTLSAFQVLRNNDFHYKTLLTEVDNWFPPEDLKGLNLTSAPIGRIGKGILGSVVDPGYSSTTPTILK